LLSLVMAFLPARVEAKMPPFVTPELPQSYPKGFVGFWIIY